MRDLGLGRLLSSPRISTPPPGRSEALPLLLVLAAALALRLVALGEVPGNVTADEADNVQFALKVRAGTGPGFFGYDWKPQPMFSVWLSAQVMQVAGWSVFGLRLPSALLSVAALVPFYLLARRQVGQVAALVGTALLATNLWYLNFSRSGWENVHVAAYALGAALFVLRGLESGRRVDWAAAGVFCALGLYGYFAGRLIVPALLAFLPFALGQRRGEWRRVLTGYALMLTVAVALFAPQAWSTLRGNPVEFGSRSREVYAFRDVQTVDEAWDVLASKVLVTGRAFLLFDPTLGYNARYNAPGRGMLDYLAAGLYLLGLIVSIRVWRDGALWWCFLLVGIGATQILTTGTPDGARAVGFAPFLYLFVALGLQALIGRLHVPTAASVAGAICLIAAYVNVAGYFAWIGQPETLHARKPAVELADFDAWREAQLVEAQAGRRGFNVGQWSAGLIPAPTGSGPSMHLVAKPTLPLTDLPRLGRPLRALSTGPALTEPRGLAVDASGDLFVADAGTGRVVRLTPDGSVRADWPIEPVDGEASVAWDVAVAAGDQVWVLDPMAGVASRYTREGRLLGTVGPGLGLYRPRGLAVDGAGHLYIADTGGNRVLKVNAEGQIMLSIGGGAATFIAQPSDVAVGPDGAIFVAEPEQGRIQKLDPEGRPVGAVAVGRSTTIDGAYLTVDERLHVLASTDPANGRVMLYRLDLTPLGFADGGRDGPPALQGPAGVATYRDRVYAVEARRALILAYEVEETRP